MAKYPKNEYIYEYGVEGSDRPPRGSFSTPRASRGAARAGVRQPRRCSEPPCPPACPDAAVTRSGASASARFTTSCTQCFPVVRSRPAHRPRPCRSRALSRPPTPSSWQVRRDVKRLCRTSAACQYAASRTTAVAAAGCVLAGTAVIHSAGCVASVLVRRVCPFHVISCRVRFSVECACAVRKACLAVSVSVVL